MADPAERERELELPTVAQEGLQRQRPGKLEGERPAEEERYFGSVILLIAHCVEVAVEL